MRRRIKCKTTEKLNKMTARELSFLKEKFSDGELDAAVKRVQSGEPLAYVLGEWYFYGLTFSLNSDCLIPRPDTEHVVEKAIQTLPKGGRFIDLCTGSGCIAVSILKNRPDLTAYALDISALALEKAKSNAATNDVDDRIEFILADIFKLDANTLPEFDAVISNPPYIRSAVVKTLDVAKTEPITALDGGEDGLDFYRFILEKYRSRLSQNGNFIFEIGYDQGADMLSLAEASGLSCQIFKDYSQNDRVALIGRS